LLNLGVDADVLFCYEYPIGDKFDSQPCVG
jgi:hypothetical protein